MKSVQVFDPAMCCSTGICGPVVDPVLPRFAADLAWLSGQGIAVKRHNLAQEPQAFVGNELVKRALTERSAACLPLVLVDGRIVSQGRYPSRGELAAFVGLDASEPATIYSPAVEELVAIGASIACNCMPCLKYHTDQARALGVSDDDMAKAVAMAQKVKQTPARLVLELANRYLNGKVEDAPEPSACCTPPTKAGAISKCCG